MDDEAEEKGKGELKYQESKVFHTEWFLCNAYDNAKAKRITVEIYGMDTQDTFTLKWEYTAFDALFRFNAELMNPNRREGRFHWVFERLGIEVVQKGNGEQVRELRLLPEPSEEVPHLPVYETSRKIPTGRMDLKERQRLREQMDMLDIRRTENITKRRLATTQRALSYITKLKELAERKQKEVDAKIEEERKLRIQMKETMEKNEVEAEVKLESMRSRRQQAVQVKEERTEEQDEEEYRQLRARWRVRDAEKAKIIEDLKEKTQKDLQARREALEAKRQKLAEVQARRDAAWTARDARVRQKEAAKLKAILEVKKERERQAKLRLERNSEALQNLFTERQPIFKAQLERTEDRRLARESESEALANYVEHRAIPKKVNKKKKKKSSKSDGEDAGKAKAKGKARSKSADSEPDGADGADAPDEGGKDDNSKDASDKPKGIDMGKALDSIEAKMRADMAETRRRELMHKQREAKVVERQTLRAEKENKHNSDIREVFRQQVTVKEQVAAERRTVRKQKDQEAQSAAERKKAERERLERVRQENIIRKEGERLRRLCAVDASDA